MPEHTMLTKIRLRLQSVMKEAKELPTEEREKIGNAMIITGGMLLRMSGKSKSLDALSKQPIPQ